jgi:hypothetical protein
MSRKDDIDEELRRVAAEFGAKVEIVNGKKHRKAHFTFRGRTGFTTISKSPSDRYAHKQAYRQAKKLLATLTMAARSAISESLRRR